MTPAEIFDVVGRLSGFGEEELRSRDRSHPLVWWRLAAMVVFRDGLGWSSSTVGRYFDRDHTTVLHSYRRARNDPELAACVHRIKAALNGGPSVGLRLIHGDGGTGGAAA